MGVTRRYRGEAVLVVVLAGLTVLFDRPILLVGVGGVGGALLARHVAFVRAVRDVATDVSVVQSPERDVTAVDGDVAVELTAELSRPAPTRLEVEANPPPGVEVVADEGSAGGSATLTVPPGETAARTTFAVHCRLAGSFEFDPATVTATDEAGRFRAEFAAGSEPPLTVEARGPRDLHVGAGGDAVESGYGRRDGDERGAGIDLAEIRAYVPGDTARQIDWKATARRNELHVREFETDTGRRTTILLDRRASMADGTGDGSKFDYLRQVALATVKHARNRGESVALFEIGEQGLLDSQPPTATEAGYVRLERRLRAVEPTSDGAARRPPDSDEPERPADERNRRVRSPAVAHRRTHRLRGDDSAFADRLRPFFETAEPYAQRVADDPLYNVARTHLDRLSGSVTTVLLTDDTRRTETREVVKVSRRGDAHVMAFLTPSVLFDRDDAADLEAAYDRYTDFERFRRDLDGIERVSAFEVGPGDRLDALLAAERAGHRAEADD